MDDSISAQFPRIRQDLDRRGTRSGAIVTWDGRTHLALTVAEAGFLDRLDGNISTRDLAREFAGDLDDFLSDLSDAGFLEGSSPTPEPRVMVSAAGVEFAGFDRLVEMFYRLAGRLLSTRTFLGLAGLLVAVGLVTQFTRSTEASSHASATTLMVLVGASVATGFLHELGHALAIHHYGRRVGRAGFGHYWGEISFFVDATDALLLTRRQRLIQTLAGPSTDALVAAVLTIAARVVSPGGVADLLNVLALSEWIVVLVNLAPVLKLDGYWAVADLLDEPDLYRKSGQAVLDVFGGVRDRRTLHLFTYAFASGLAGIGAILSTVLIWKYHYLSMIGDVLNQGPVGVVAVSVFVGPQLAGLGAGMTHLVRLLINPTRGSENQGKEVRHEKANPQNQPETTLAISEARI